jgi:hypothetical protein
MQKFESVRVDVVENGFVAYTRPAMYGEMQRFDNSVFVFESFESLIEFLGNHMKNTGIGGADRKHEE